MIDLADFDFQQYNPLLQLGADGGPSGALIKELRAELGASLSQVVMEAVRLQPKARAKLGGGTWWCTERALQQATPRPVAEIKATLCGGVDHFDLCSGIGGDAVAVSRRMPPAGQVTLVDRDPLMVAMARANLAQPAGCAGVHVHCGEVVSVDVRPSSFLHIDPDRRDEVGRKTRPEDYSPNWSAVQSLLRRCAGGLVKIAPAARLDDHDHYRRLWISWDHSVREQTLLFGDAISVAEKSLALSLPKGHRSAIQIDTHGTWRTYTGTPAIGIAERSDKPLDWMVDPDPAIRASGLTESFAIRGRFHMLGGPAGFLTSHHRPDSKLCESASLQFERVIWSGACDDRKLRKTLRSMNRYPWRVKTRGVSQDPNTLEKRYRSCGELPVTLWIGKGNHRQYAALTESPVVHPH